MFPDGFILVRHRRMSRTLLWNVSAVVPTNSRARSWSLHLLSLSKLCHLRTAFQGTIYNAASSITSCLSLYTRRANNMVILKVACCFSALQRLIVVFKKCNCTENDLNRICAFYGATKWNGMSPAVRDNRQSCHWKSLGAAWLKTCLIPPSHWYCLCAYNGCLVWYTYS